MNNLIKKIKKAPWVLGQPLTKKPKNANAKISDLFVWRANQDWKTFFELIHFSALFGDDTDYEAEFIFFSRAGEKILTHSIKPKPNMRQLVDISAILQTVDTLEDYGTFAVFHQHQPQVIGQFNTFLAERGYVSYQYKNAPLRAYIHGNLDAIAQDNTQLNLLAGRSVFNRQYKLQYTFDTNTPYELVFVNSSDTKQDLTIQYMCTKTHTISDKQLLSLHPKQSCVVKNNLKQSAYVIINSKMIMARPVVFTYNKNKMDVFHG